MMSTREEYESALKKAMALCSSREYCISEIRSKIIEWGLAEKESQKITDVLVKEKYIDEARYASAFARDKFRFNKWGRIKIGMMLNMKGLHSSLIKEALKSIDQEEYLNVLQDLISSKRKTIKAGNNYEASARLLRYGLSKGFEKDIIMKVISDHW